jgi:FAD/FMN-containing dehydrogenase
VLIELGLSAGRAPQAALEILFEAAVAQGLADDGVIAQSETQRDELWAMREMIPEANRLVGAISSHDISLPLGMIPEFVACGRAALGALGDFRINCFGHLGDGNLHYNVYPLKGRSRDDYKDQQGAIVDIVYGLVDEMGGSFSAEHGVGRLKVGDLERYGDPVRLDAMRAIKAALDPAGIMNPGAVLR